MLVPGGAALVKLTAVGIITPVMGGKVAVVSGRP